MDNLMSTDLGQTILFLSECDSVCLEYIFKALSDEQLDKINDYSVFEIMDRGYPEIGD